MHNIKLKHCQQIEKVPKFKDK